ncbi:protein of unknown function [Hymenobacter daecheongensis DSM 21074]|uniref:DUF4184 family protein n=1 Tax=Hymenobacter daecheongensis DSM 21074 TaxID=1121955 RepID=A0A1M6CNE6_9BACT|nr:DUF4184 family protein [Hymenobacter daecheongensis]SHI62526.1 protein of unknown function [Hymenobacter daecheongensis DSM 21074]
MPFTPAHPALILPLLRPCRRWLSATGLVLGAMAPDFEYFLRLRPDGIYGHTLAGIFWLDLPLILVFAALFHGLVKQPLVASLPDFLRRRMLPLVGPRWPWRRVLASPVLLGGLVGTVSHLVWDAFTHVDGLAVLHWPALQQPIGPLLLYTWLQLGGTVGGLAAILIYLLRLPATVPRIEPGPAGARRTFWLGIGAAMVVLWGPFAWFSAQIWPFDLSSVVVTGMSAALVGLLAAAAVVRRHGARAAE